MSHSIVYESWTFTSDKIKEGNLYLATSLLSSSLEVNSFAPVVECDDPSILDFQRNAKLLYYAEPGRPMVFRVQNIKRIGPSLYEISATSTLGLLTEGQHMGGIYTGQEAEEVILDICGTVPVEIKNNLKKIKLYGWLPIAAPRDNLAQVLFAIGAALKTDLDGVLRVETLWDGISGQVPQDNMYTDANVDYSARITQVIVTEHQYVPWTEEKQLFEGTAQAGDVITFDEPMHDLAAEGFTILASGANWAQVSAGSGTLTGKTYLHNTRQVSKAVQEASTPNVKTVEDATLVSLANATAVAQRLADYYRCRERVDSPVVYQGEAPGDRLATWHPFDKVGVAACLESADITLSNTLKAQEKMLVGFVPPQANEFQYFDTRIVLTGNGRFKVPEGTTSIRCVCIGAGDAGYSGASGNDADPPDHTVMYGAYKNGAGAKGGKGGAVGANGKVVVDVIDVSPGEFIDYSCGVGGVGRPCVKGQGNVTGGKGGETTFGPVSSSEGVSSETGYYDEITGESFANTVSLPGIDGGDGSGATGEYMSQFVRGPSVTDRNGNVWLSGVTGDKIARNEVYLTSEDGYDLYIYSVSGSGGGAAVGENGSNGHPGSVTSTTAYTGTGGKGADAKITPEKQDHYGAGGHGGHGGGAGGGAGECYSMFRPAQKTYLLGPNGPGGLGSKGGDGADGCIILYFRFTEKSPAGQLVDKNNKMVLDRLGRRIIM